MTTTHRLDLSYINAQPPATFTGSYWEPLGTYVSTATWLYTGADPEGFGVIKVSAEIHSTNQNDTGNTGFGGMENPGVWVHITIEGPINVVSVPPGMTWNTFSHDGYFYWDYLHAFYPDDPLAPYFEFSLITDGNGLDDAPTYTLTQGVNAGPGIAQVTAVYSSEGPDPEPEGFWTAKVNATEDTVA